MRTYPLPPPAATTTHKLEATISYKAAYNTDTNLILPHLSLTDPPPSSLVPCRLSQTVFKPTFEDYHSYCAYLVAVASSTNFTTTSVASVHSLI